EGKAIRSIHQISSPAIAIEMQDGVVEANITQVIPNEE
ncbi:hypothetical protein RFY16_10590, partial [Acinetobacter baumannii]|nr:hypothetical protein [Acinetobacter baumannii]